MKAGDDANHLKRVSIFQLSYWRFRGKEWMILSYLYDIWLPLARYAAEVAEMAECSGGL